jgi:hypothetical protein
MTTPEGDELLAIIRQYVHGRVPPAYEEATVEVVATTMVTLMSEPRFYNHLRVVIDLQKRVLQLETAIRRYQEKAPPRPRTAPRAAKKPPKPPLPYNVKQFKRGVRGE